MSDYIKHEVKVYENNCNRCGNTIKDLVCENCRRIDAEYKHCSSCGRYTMHYQGDAVCVICTANHVKVKEIHLDFAH